MTFDFIGILSDGEKILAGFHVNATPDEITPELEPFVVHPSAMLRVFAGDDPLNAQQTVALRFNSEQKARTAIPQMTTDTES